MDTESSREEYLVDGKYGIEDLVDVEQLRTIFERFTEATGFTIGFLDHPDMNILIASGWRDICTKFHRGCPLGEANCVKSNRHLLDQLTEPGKLVIEPCDNGLVDCAIPVIIKGVHVASLATGQLLLDQPDLERFRRQARRFGLDEHEYLAALKEVPVVAEEKLRSVTALLGEIAVVLSQLGYTHLVVREEAEHLAKEIAERKQAEEALAAEREQLLVTLRSIGDGVITADTEGRVTLMNKIAEDLTGWSLAEADGRPLDEVLNIVDVSTRERCDNPVTRILHSGQIIALGSSFVLICRDGGERIVTDSGAPIRDHNGAITGVVLVFRDITNQQKAEDALRNAQKLESLGELAAGIAHDFNNYLGGILGHVDLALDSAKSGNAPQAAMELTQISGIFDKARGLTQQLLTFARGAAPVLKPGSVVNVVHETASFSISGSAATLAFSASAELPVCAFDAGQISQVIQNLVINAQQAMPHGGVIDVSVRPATVGGSHPALASGTYVQITVRDTGDGIPEEMIPRVFDPFYTTKPKGSGLGLSVCYSIVKKHGGHIEVTSVRGEGAQFTVYLPAGSDAVQAELDDKPLSMHRGSGQALVMDDEESMRGITSAMLQRLGYRAIALADGADVLDILKTDVFDLIMLDLTVPGGMGGIETANEIRRLYGNEITILAMSGYTDSHVMADPHEYGFDGRIAKPFRMQELGELLDMVMRRADGGDKG